MNDYPTSKALQSLIQRQSEVMKQITAMPLATSAIFKNSAVSNMSASLELFSKQLYNSVGINNLNFSDVVKQFSVRFSEISPTSFDAIKIASESFLSRQAQLSEINVAFESLKKSINASSLAMKNILDEDDGPTDTFIDKATAFLSECPEATLNELTFADEYVEMPSVAATAFSKFADIPIAEFEKVPEKNVARIKNALFSEFILPLLIGLLLAAPQFSYEIHHNIQQDIETELYHQEMLKEEHRQTIELQKQTKLLQEEKDSDD